jgi:hypothetical protein
MEEARWERSTYRVLVRKHEGRTPTGMTQVLIEVYYKNRS